MIEHSYISAVFQDNRVMTHRLRPQHFGDSVCRAIFEAMISIKGPIDPITVMAASKIDLPLITEIALAPGIPANAESYIDSILEASASRALQQAVQKAAGIADGAGTVSERIQAIQDALNAIQRASMSREPESLSSSIARALDRYEELAQGKREAAWSTGVNALDEMFAGGLRPGKVYGLAARPSVGKSSAARLLTVACAKQLLPTLILSQEMPIDEVTDCLVAQLGGINAKRLITGKLSDDDWGRMAEAADDAMKLPIFIDDDGGLTIQQVAAKCRLIKGLKVLVLDYLQLCSSDLKANTNDQVGEISKGLKRLAIQMGISIVVLSQLNREVERRQDKEPQLSDLRDSGNIEQDLDACVMLWTVKEDEDSRLVGWKVAKNRSGNRGSFAMRFYPATYTWVQSLESLKPIQQKYRGFGHDD